MKKETRQKIINSVIGSSKHEGYQDDGFNRSVLKRKAAGEISSAEAKKLMIEEALK